MKRYIKTICFAIAGLFLVSCADQLVVEPPNNIIDEQIMEILQSGDTAKIRLVMSSLAADLDANFRLNNSGYSGGFSSNSLNASQNHAIMRVLTGNDVVRGSKIRGGSTSDIFYLSYMMGLDYEFWRGDLIATNGFWMSAADPVTNGNKVLAYLEDEEMIKNNKLLMAYRARCLTVRAYGYMLLMERFQKPYLRGGKEGKGMPIYTKYAVNVPVAPSSAVDTYNFIMKDLNEAVKLFHDSETGEGKDGFTIKDTRDVDCGVAQMVLARVALWTGNYEACIAACQDILKHYPTLIAEENYGIPNTLVKDLAEQKADVKADDNAFSCLKVNPEVIIGWPDGNGAQTYQYIYFNTFAEGDGGEGEYFMRMDDRLHKLIADDDLRKDRFIMDEIEYTYPTRLKKATILKYTNLKWGATIALQQTVRNDKANSDFTLYRSSEALLMMAEAQAMAGKENDAKQTLNILLAARTKNEAGQVLTCDTYPSMKGMAALDMVKLQWRIEMWGENGHEFYNNKRWGVNIDRNGSAVHYSDNKTLSADRMTLEIPTQETSTNPNWGL